MDEHGVQVKEIINAKKEAIPGDEALRLAQKTDQVWAAKGKAFLTFSLDCGTLQDATKDDLRKAIVGPSGNLRAPSLWVGKTLVVGFHPDMYKQLL